MIEKFFFTRTVRYRNDRLPGKPCQFDNPILDAVTWALWSVGGYGNVVAFAQVMNDFPYGGDTPFPERTTNRAESKKCHDPGNQFSVTMPAYKNLSLSS